MTKTKIRSHFGSNYLRLDAWVLGCDDRHCVTLFFTSMPHVHSVAASAARRRRALEKGFLVCKDADCSYVQVSANVAGRVRAVAKSLSLHRQHCSTVGRSYHFAASAALAAKASIGHTNFQEACRVHRVANKAKHCWADCDFDDDTDSSVAAPDHIDPLVAIDPWAHAASLLPDRTVSPTIDANGAKGRIST